ncbi:hypothetical protein Tco_0986405 [Tanacetum coccineum]
MSEEDQTVEVVPPVKSDMHSYSSTMTAKDVKALALKHNIPLDLHPVALTAEWTMDKLTDDFIGLYEQYFEFSGVRVLRFQHLLGVPWTISVCTSLRDWFTFERRVGPGSGGKILNETFSGQKGWKKRFFFLDRRAIPQLWLGGITTPTYTIPFLPMASVPLMERKARAAAKKRAERKRAADGEGGSKGKTKRRKVSAVRAEEEDSTEEASSASPLRAMAPNPSFLLKDGDDVETAESREDEHVSIPRHDSANTSIHNYAEDHDESFNESEGHGLTMTETVETHHANETRLTETPVPAPNPEKTAVQDIVPVVRSNLAGDRADGAESSRPGSVYVPEWTIHRRSRVDTPEEWLGSVLPEEPWLKLMLSFADIKQARDSALVFSDRISNERAAENERLVSQLGFLKKEKIDSIGKLLPTVVRRLLSSHEYKESLSVPFNLAIQAGWAKGLAMKRSKEDLMEVLREVQGFDPHSDTRMTVEYDKLFTKTYPYVEKISGLPRRTVQELLKMYPVPPPEDALTRVNPSSKVASVSRAVPSKVIPTATTTASKVTPSVTRSDKNPDPSHPPDSSKSAPKRG